MYKIKDEVDLKELEKFGFNKYKYYSGNVNYYRRDRVQIREDTKIIEIPTQNNRYDTEMYIQDLIQANIVEKVEE